MQLIDYMEEALNLWRYKVEKIHWTNLIHCKTLMLRDISAAENIITKSFDVLEDEKL